MSEVQLFEGEGLLHDVGLEDDKTVLEIEGVEREVGFSEILLFPYVVESDIDPVHADLHVVQEPIDYIPKIAAFTLLPQQLTHLLLTRRFFARFSR
jgi:hypothetical protein